MIAHMHIDEFIDVERDDPVGPGHDVETLGHLERGELHAPLIIGTVIAHMGQPARLGQQVEHIVAAILAIVREDKEIGHARRPVMGQPFDKKGGLVPDGQNSKYLQGVALPRRRRQLSMSKASA